MRPALRNFIYNLIGQLLPMLVAVFALPILVHQAGAERLGYLGLAWALIGYFALLDLGLSRVVTRRIAMAVGSGTLKLEGALVRRLCLRLFVAVAIIALILALAIPAQWMVGKNASEALIAEAKAALPILWATLPATVVTGLLRGSLEGLKRFGAANLLRGSFGIWSYAAPLAVLPWSQELPALTLALAIGRYLALFAHIKIAFRALPDSRLDQADAALPVRFMTMIKEGSWLTVSNIVGPVMVTFDRFAIASIISLTAAGYYFVPQEMALRLLIIPGAIATTIFPMLASTSKAPKKHDQLPNQALLATVVTSLPACALFASLAQPVMTLWMGATFAQASAPIASVLAIGLFANCCAQIPFAWIQAVGRADVTGKLHLLQLPLYCGLMLLLTWQYGIIGAAWAWAFRATADCILLLIASRRLFAHISLSQGQLGMLLGLAGLILICLSGALTSIFLHWIIVGFVLIFIAVSSLHWGLTLRRSLHRSN
jgi:O-antigen/teichoic acid export membrane protein